MREEFGKRRDEMTGATRRSFLKIGRMFSALALPHTLKAGPPFPPLQQKRNSAPLLNEAGNIASRFEGECQYFDEDLGGGLTIEMTKIPRGTFAMGSDERPEEKPPHTVTVHEFFLGTYEVTREQWRKVSALPKVRRKLGAIYRLREMPEEVENQLPVDGVWFRDAQEFCERLRRATGRTYRFPSETEWEYACRAGTSTKYHFGDAISLEVANYNALQRPLGLEPVGSKNAPNQFGLHDMHGNVLEWTEDWAHESFTGAPSDGSAWLAPGSSSRRVMKGGMFLWGPERARSSARTFWHTSGTASGIGFRLALSIGD